MKYGLIVMLCILTIAAAFFSLLRPILLTKLSEKYLPEPYAGPEIHLAAMEGDIDIVRSMVSEKPELLTQTDKYGNSPLHLAAYEGQTEVVRFLIFQGVDVNVRNNFGGTALLVACYAGETEVVQMLIANGADSNLAIKESKQQVLQICSLEGYRDYSHAFSDEAAIINVKVHFIASPLQAAVANGHKEIANLLVANGADINVKLIGNTALHSAAVNGEKELVELLIANGADIDARNLSYSTPLCSAMFYCRETIDRDSIYAVAKVLIENGADVNTRTSGGNTPLHFAAGFGTKESLNF